MLGVNRYVAIASLTAWAGLASVACPDDEPWKLSVRTYVVTDIVAREGQTDRIEQDTKRLAEVVRSFVSADSWDAADGPGKIAAAFPGKEATLVVRAMSEVHELIQDLLASLRQAARDTAAGKPKICYGGSSEPTAAEKKILKALDRKVTVDFNKTPLTEVARFLSKQTGVKFVLDKRALDDVLEAFQPNEYDPFVRWKDMVGLSAGKARILIVSQSQPNHRLVIKWLDLLRALVRDGDGERKPPLRRKPAVLATQ